MKLPVRLPFSRPNATSASAIQLPDIVHPMSRRDVSHSVASAVITLPRARPRVRFKPGFGQPISRLFVWFWVLLRFYAGNFADAFRGQASTERRAVRLRQAFELGGPTFAKLAQQLSLRADMLPYSYCVELSKMLDQAAAFPTEQAIEIIERSTGRPITDIFDAFDPKPIGSASLACVYQAQLKTGELVAVKVRRPGIGPLIAADLRAFDWILIVAEILTIIPPGVTRRFREDFETILFNEMNFRAEARYTNIFRKRAAKRKRNDVTAPRVFFQYCSEEVLVSEFVSGVWMWEILAAVDSDDQQFLAKIAEQGIEPKKLASRLMRVMNREVQEELFFHADPHPANLIVMPNNKICFIDFGAIGRFSTQTRKMLREMSYHTSKGDIGRLVNTSLAFLGPLPPMDVDKIRYEMEKIYSDAVYALNSDDAEWWEKSSAQGWLRFLEVSRQFTLPATFESLLFFRTTFSYDVIIHRLNRNIDLIKEYEVYTRERAKEAAARMKSGWKERLRGPSDRDYMALEELGDLFTLILFQLQRNVELPIVHFRNMIGKIAYIVSLFVKLGFLVGLGIAGGLVANFIARRWFGHEIDWSPILEKATTFGWVQLGLIGICLVILRRIMIRLSLPDTRLPER
jgi:ubiquinone biosynthesis protein